MRTLSSNMGDSSSCSAWRGEPRSRDSTEAFEDRRRARPGSCKPFIHIFITMGGRQVLGVKKKSVLKTRVKSEEPSLSGTPRPDACRRGKDGLLNGAGAFQKQRISVQNSLLRLNPASAALLVELDKRDLCRATGVQARLRVTRGDLLASHTKSHNSRQKSTSSASRPRVLHSQQRHPLRPAAITKAPPYP